MFKTIVLKVCYFLASLTVISGFVAVGEIIYLLAHGTNWWPSVWEGFKTLFILEAVSMLGSGIGTWTEKQ